MSEREGQAQEAFDRLSKDMLLSRLNVLLESTHEIAYSTVSQHYHGLPANGSRMAADVREVSDEAVAEVEKVCGAWHVVAAECLGAVASAHRDGRILFAPGPLFRTVIEHTARIGWILDGSTARSRAARAWLAEVVGNGQDAKTHDNRGSPVLTLAGARERLEELSERTLPRMLGESPDRSKRDPDAWTLLDQEWGHYTKLVDDFFRNCVNDRWGPATSGTVQYRVATMFAHPSVTANYAQASVSDSGVAWFTWDWSLVRTRSGVALACFESATRALYDYLRWDPPAFRAWTAHLGRFVTDTQR